MARRAKSSDDAYNARRRYYRSAQRNFKKAEKSSGANAARYRAIARQDLEDALSTYDPNAPKQKISKPIRDLAQKFNIDIEGQRGEFIASTERERERAISRSEVVLESTLQNELIRREREAYAVLNEPSLGRRIIGGFVDIWRDKATDYETGKIDKSKIIPALLDYFQVRNLADMLQKVENMIGDILYSEGNQDVMYEAVKILIQTKVADNTVTV